ncbi:hypothetical protein DdX_13820 [Ditylenchus destructor]|uniref:Uncharacterized protein n=1 Tax=Ditylenchus destructor TaxID=166010 RepID=A0AAD4MTQ7_9BILA|nr:hypothetical protein DdX_13820 [Ditylenchus destructor]
MTCLIGNFCNNASVFPNPCAFHSFIDHFTLRFPSAQSALSSSVTARPLVLTLMMILLLPWFLLCPVPFDETAALCGPAVSLPPVNILIVPWQRISK